MWFQVYFPLIDSQFREPLVLSDYEQERLKLGSGMKYTSSTLSFERQSDFRLLSLVIMKNLRKQSETQKHETRLTDDSVPYPTRQLLLDETNRFIGATDW
jgi:hypothetical protein